MEKNKALEAHLSIFAACAIWGLMAPLGKDAMTHGLDGITMVSFRVMGGAILFWLTTFVMMLLKRRRGESLPHVPLRDRLTFAGAAVFGLVCNQCCFTILPVIRDRIQSKLNNFREYTILDAGKLAEFIGFTTQEVQALCKKHGADFEEYKRWYDGYSQHGFEIYNPESVVMSIDDGECQSYWSKTSTYAVIADRIQQNFEGAKDDVIKMIAGESVDVIVTTYMNTMTDFKTKDDVFTYLIHLGYLAYNREDKTCRIPNKEVLIEWQSAVAVVDEYKTTNKIIKASKELLAETLRMNEEAVAKSLDESHINVTSNRNYNNEDALQSAIYLSYIYALNKYTIVKEMTTGKGFADVVFIPFVPNIPAMIIELKRNDSAESAINQIRQKKYFASLEHYTGDLLFVGVNYDAETKTHDCKIEKLVK